MEFIGKLVSNNTSKIGMIVSTPTKVSVKFSDKFIHILNNKEISNELKVRTNIQRRESLFKYQPHT